MQRLNFKHVLCSLTLGFLLSPSVFAQETNNENLESTPIESVDIIETTESMQQETTFISETSMTTTQETFVENQPITESDLPEGMSLEEAKEFIEADPTATEDTIRLEKRLEEFRASTEGSDFYEIPDKLPEKDGTLLKQKSGKFYLDPLRWIEHKGKVINFMYKTTDSRQRARGAVATLLEAIKPNGNVIIHAPGTQGLSDASAPSRQLAMGTEYEGINVMNAVNVGYSVVVVDYIGLGPEGTHTYMNRKDQAHAVIDAARAVSQLQGTWINKKTPLQFRGYSQGGGAAGAALELAPTRAPELNLVSGAIGAPPADMIQVAEKIDGTLYNGFLLFSLASIVESEGLNPEKFLNEEGLKRLSMAQNQSTMQALISHAFIDTRTLTKDGKSFSELVKLEPFANILNSYKLGMEGRHPNVPVLITHSLTDDVIPFSVGYELGRRWATLGTMITFEMTPVPTHIGAFFGAMPRVAIYTARLFEGLSPIIHNWWWGIV